MFLRFNEFGAPVNNMRWESCPNSAISGLGVLSVGIIVKAASMCCEVRLARSHGLVCLLQ